MEKQALVNLDAGKSYLDGNAKQDGIKVTDSGLQYKVLAEGDGPKPDQGNQVSSVFRVALMSGASVSETDGQCDKMQARAMCTMCRFPFTSPQPKWLVWVVML